MVGSRTIESRATFWTRPRRTNNPGRFISAAVGHNLETVPFAGCSCADDEAEFLRRSFVAGDGESMSVIVFAPTPGRAISVADRYREWLIQQDLWASALQLQPI